MRVSRYTAFFFLLSTQYAWASGASVVPPDRASDSGFVDGVQQIVPALCADEIFWQSGGVRVRAGDLDADGLQVYDQFMVNEHQAQRAFIWHGLKLGNINFAHLGASTPLIQPVQAKDITNYSEDELRKITRPFGFDSTQEIIEFSQLPGISLELLSDVAWNLDNARRFVQYMNTNLWYNDMPGANADLPASHAYQDPRYRDNDAVVNYRASVRTLIKECLDILGYSNSNDSDPAMETPKLLERLRLAVKSTGASELGLNPAYRDVLVHKELQKRRPHTLNIDVNVDVLVGKYPPNEMYQAITKEIDTHIERTLNDAASIADATKDLQVIGNEETARANKYAGFNDPISQEMVQLQLRVDVPMCHNIEEVYKRAVLRREEFHKMTEPFVVSAAHATTYRVHFTDPEYRYVGRETAIAPGSKQWYQATWKRLLEPIFKGVIIEELKDSSLRDIVLVGSDPSELRGTLAYVNMQQHIVIFCDELDLNHREARATIRHEYEHMVDYTTGSRTSQRYRLMEDDRDLRTLSQETLERKIDAATIALHNARHGESKAARKHLHALEVAKNAWAFGGASVPYNADNCFGFPSAYAQSDAVEAVAEQRYAMRKEAIRTALLRRMSRYAIPGLRQADAARQKIFYDVARQEMEHVAPNLWKQWGTNYDGLDAHEWGLAPGETQRMDKHYQIMTLDNTIATMTASERLAAKLLQQGYDVSITAYDPLWDRPICLLQSNLEDPPPGGRYPKFELLIVGGSAMDGKAIAHYVFRTFHELTPTGRKNHHTSSTYDLNFEAVTFIRSPQYPMFVSMSTNEELRTAFVKEFRVIYVEAEAPKQISMHDGHVDVAHDGRIVSLDPRGESQESIWVHDKNLYRNTIFDGWSVGNREVWEGVDYEVQTQCLIIGS